MPLIPLARMASSTLNVAIVFCCKSLPGCSRPKRTSALAREVKHELAPRHRRRSARAGRGCRRARAGSRAAGARLRGKVPGRWKNRPSRRPRGPRARRRSVRLLPMNPAAPVMKYFMDRQGRAGAGRDAISAKPSHRAKRNFACGRLFTDAGQFAPGGDGQRHGHVGVHVLPLAPAPERIDAVRLRPGA